jgi:hypothetical protein
MEINELFAQLDEQYDMVLEFQETFDPGIDTSNEKIKFRMFLIHEEGTIEYNNAFSEENRVEVLDSICDTLYVILGAYIKLGIPLALTSDEGNSELYNEFKHTLEHWLEKIDKRIKFFGLKEWRDAFKEVHRSNMSKGCKTEREALDTINSYLIKGVITHHELINGTYVIYRTEDKKVMKSINYSPAELAPFI